jgi:hypothetical protein
LPSENSSVCQGLTRIAKYRSGFMSFSPMKPRE